MESPLSVLLLEPSACGSPSSSFSSAVPEDRPAQLKPLSRYQQSCSQERESIYGSGYVSVYESNKAMSAKRPTTLVDCGNRNSEYGLMAQMTDHLNGRHSLYNSPGGGSPSSRYASVVARYRNSIQFVNRCRASDHKPAVTTDQIRNSIHPS